MVNSESEWNSRAEAKRSFPGLATIRGLSGSHPGLPGVIRPEGFRHLDEVAG